MDPAGQAGRVPDPGWTLPDLADEVERFQKTHGFGAGIGEPLRVLVVDDQRDVADVIAASLSPFHPRARMETAANGFEGLLKVGTFRPDILLLDLSMPGVDGFEVCRQIKRDPVIRDTKVVVMTARSRDADPLAMEAGADGVLSKPFVVDAVRGLLARLFGPRR